jgi:hypothetical protein
MLELILLIFLETSTETASWVLAARKLGGDPPIL